MYENESTKFREHVICCMGLDVYILCEMFLKNDQTKIIDDYLCTGNTNLTNLANNAQRGPDGVCFLIKESVLVLTQFKYLITLLKAFCG